MPISATDASPPAAKSLVVLPAGQGESLHAAGTEMSVKTSAEETAGTLAVVEYTAPAYYPGPPQHVHPGLDEAWYVLDGELTLIADGVPTVLTPAGFAFTPGAMPHTFANNTDTPVRFLVICTPGGFEGYFRELAALTAAGDPGFEAIGALAGRYGSYIA